MIDLIVDLQYGSTGKGLLAGFLAESKHYDAVVTCNMPNAGHTYIDRKGNKMIHKVLPNGVVSAKCRYAMIGPGAVFSPQRLQEELYHLDSIGYDHFIVIIHPNAVILLEEYAHMEQSALNGISSTMQGSMAATLAKMSRDGTPLAKHYSDSLSSDRVTVTTHEGWMNLIDQCENILAEGSQGFSLGLNQRFWPYCTSRECTPARMISDMALPFYDVWVWGTLRTFPIRVGNTEGGFSGNHYSDQEETSWEDLGLEPEFTTVTGRRRRVFSYSQDQAYEAMWHCRPDSIFLNFCNYVDETVVQSIKDHADESARTLGCGSITHFGYGPAYGDVLTNPRSPESIFGK